MDPQSGLFDRSGYTKRTVEGTLERVPLEQLRPARNPRRDMSAEGIDRLAGMLMRTGQLVPVIARRATDEEVLLYAGQRRLLAARRSHELAGREGFERLAPVGALVAQLLDYEPGEADIRRIQAQENQREDLSMRDQQEQFRDCWEDRAGVPDRDRIALVCADLGIAPRRARNLLRQLALPEPIRRRVAERPSGDGISVTLANRLADLHDTSPPLAAAVAARITSSDLHDRALRDLGAFVQRTVVEDDELFAVRIDEGALLDAHQQLERARTALTDTARAQVAQVLGCLLSDVERELDALDARARSRALALRVDATLRERAQTGRYAWTHSRGADFADAVWVIDPVFVIAAVHEQLSGTSQEPAREEAFFAGAGLRDDELDRAAVAERERRDGERRRRQQAQASNTGLGHDIAAGLLEPSAEQLRALQALVCHLLAHHHPEVIAYGAGWTDPARQQPVGDSGRTEPRQVEAILAAELQRALEDRDPLLGIAQLVARWAAAYLLDPDGVTRTKALGAERMARRLHDALPATHGPLREAVWAFMRPMLSPRLADLHRDAFATQETRASTVDLAAHRADGDLADLDLGDEPDAVADAA